MNKNYVSAYYKFNNRCNILIQDFPEFRLSQREKDSNIFLRSKIWKITTATNTSLTKNDSKYQMIYLQQLLFPRYVSVHISIYRINKSQDEISLVTACQIQTRSNQVKFRISFLSKINSARH